MVLVLPQVTMSSGHLASSSSGTHLMACVKRGTMALGCFSLNLGSFCSKSAYYIQNSKTGLLKSKQPTAVV